jgi:hypothetical protein
MRSELTPTELAFFHNAETPLARPRKTRGEIQLNWS